MSVSVSQILYPTEGFGRYAGFLEPEISKVSRLEPVIVRLVLHGVLERCYSRIGSWEVDRVISFSLSIGEMVALQLTVTRSANY